MQDNGLGVRLRWFTSLAKLLLYTQFCIARPPFVLPQPHAKEKQSDLAKLTI